MKISLVQYVCDTCNNSVVIPRNIRGIETLGLCTITNGCKGRLVHRAASVSNSSHDRPHLIQNQRKLLHNHTQKRSSSTWTITHNMNAAVVASAFVIIDGTFVERVPSTINVIDNNTISLVFDTQITGVAQLLARAAGALTYDDAAATQTPNTFVQVSADRELTIATTFRDDAIRLFFKYITPDASIIPVSEVIDSTPGVKSPWSSVDRVLINGRVHVVRSIDLITNAISSGLVPDGTTIHFEGFQTDLQNPVPSVLVDQSIAILRASEPYEAPDRLYDSVVDLVSTTLTIAHNELVIDASATTNIHPPIRVI